MDLFWDFDGTLFDTYPIMVESFEAALTANQVLHTTAVDLYQAMRRGSLGKTLAKYAHKNGLDLANLKQDYAKYESEILGRAIPFSNAYEVCQKNVLWNGRNFLLTHRDDQAKKLLAMHGFGELFTGYVTGANQFPRKPNPASLNYLIKQFKVNKKTAIMIGDRNLDILAAHNAGIKGILFDPDHTIQVTSSPEKQIKYLAELLVIFN